MKKKRGKFVLLGEGELGIANSYGESAGGFTIPTAFGLTKANAYLEWKNLSGIRIVGKRVRLYAEVLGGEKKSK